MSYSLNVSQVVLSLGQNHFGGITVSVCGVTAGFAHEKIGRAAGSRIGQTSTRGNVTIDALVVEVASRLPKPVAIMTSDFKDISALADEDIMVLDLSAN